MTKRIIFIIFVIFSINNVYSQEDSFIKGEIFSRQTGMPIANVHVLNLAQVKGTTTDEKGKFTLEATVNDTLYISFLGYKSIKIRVNEDMITYPGTRIGMTELAYALEEVIITPYRLTGYLSIDVKNLPINDSFQYSISGLELGYESRKDRADDYKKPKLLQAIFNPVDFLYNAFNSKNRELKKLKKLKENEALTHSLLLRYDRETLTEILNIDKNELEDVLRHCKYSQDFISKANDMQILDALYSCYEEYRILNKK